jgi:hypothetical protein
MPSLAFPSRRRSQIAGMSMTFFYLNIPLLVLLPVAVASPYGVVGKGAAGRDARYNCAPATPEGGAEAACIKAASLSRSGAGGVVTLRFGC